MSTIANLPVLLQSQPLLAKIASIEQNAPLAQAQFSAELAREAQKRVMEQVEKVQEGEGTEAIHDDRKRDRRGQQQASSQHRQHEPEPEDETPAKTPWSGNIINVKI